MLSLVSTEEASGLDLGSCAPGEFLVEADDTLHADGIRGRTNSLDIAPRRQYIPMFLGLVKISLQSTTLLLPNIEFTLIQPHITTATLTAICIEHKGYVHLAMRPMSPHISKVSTTRHNSAYGPWGG